MPSPRSILLSGLFTAIAASTALAQTNFSNVHPIFQAKCAPCHAGGGSGGFNIGAPNPNSAYLQSQQASYYVPGQTKAFASLVRIQDGSMPPGSCTGDPAQDVGNPECLTAVEQAAIEQWILDGQLPPGPPVIASFCAGDGSTLPCPCANSGGAGRGCANSTFPEGGLLAGSGTARVATDSLVLTATEVTGTWCVFFQGTAEMPPVIVDDGLGCVSGAVIRLGTKSIVGNTSAYPAAGDPSISVRGALSIYGGTRYYQAFYRNASSAFCPPATSNRTNGVRVVWGI